MVNTRDMHVVSELPTNRAQQSELRPSPSPSNDTPRRATKPRLLHGAHIQRTVDAAPGTQQKWVNEPNSNGRGRRRAYVTSSTHAHAPPSCQARMPKERQRRQEGSGGRKWRHTPTSTVTGSRQTRRQRRQQGYFSKVSSSSNV